MIPAVQAVICGRRRVPVTKTFPAGATTPWTAPTTTSRIDTASGTGADGTPGTPSTPVQKTDEQYTFYRTDGGADYQTATVNGWPDGPTYYCDPYTPFDSPPYNAYVLCHSPYTDYVGGSNPTTGASATAFGQTFPGGAGGPATVTTFNNLIVTPGASYNIVVPPGGSLTITYFQ